MTHESPRWFHWSYYERISFSWCLYQRSSGDSGTRRFMKRDKKSGMEEDD
jgi:hypothetical protein